ncbi:MAG TPA: bifunctional phosphopantothenoylcysteine decarboxylase/phosphopantothenate--cysteine ligase CoaBC [Rhodocyclaceae bacterium]|nr:bifunctional phosphopantothenoylcysteine decarboxylase/phosphopantothenate--cysteine ligase CoaBC [Rhodocyclaceae bacterium]
MRDLENRRVVLGVTGGVAAYKAVELVRLLTKQGADVQVVMTEAALHFVGAATFQAVSGKPVFTDQWDTRMANGMAHIDLTRGADVVLVAPASADFIAKVAHGLADDLLSTLVLARDCRLILVPAMNRQMWENPATRRNVATVQGDGVTLFGPASGDQACGEVGEGRMLEAAEIVDDLVAWLAPKILAGKRLLLTAGPTFEAIDPVRGITNLSTGRMGFAIAQAAREAGAEVTLVSGPVSLPTPRGVCRIDVASAQEMHDAVLPRAAAADIFVGVAAVADYRVANAAGQKLKKEAGGIPPLQLVENPDILARVAALPGAPYCVGFAAESEQLDEHAAKKRQRKKIPLIAANLVQDGFGGDTNCLVLFDDAGRHPLPAGSKLGLARQLVAEIAARLPSR